MASRFETFSEDEICAINEAVGWPVEKYFHAELATKL